MRIGVVFPQTEIGDDPAKVRDFAQAAEALGFDHLIAYDHVLGADASRPGGWTGAYTSESAFYEPFALFAYLAAITHRIEMVSGVFILPQRQTALFAKQAATVDVLCGGRLRLGIGLGWNAVEFEALGEDFHNRGARIVEQIEVLRRLWTEPVIDYRGRWHRIDRAGIKPLPVQRPIPLWMGAGRRVAGAPERALRRMARHADGWFTLLQPTPEGEAVFAQVRGYVREAGRDPERFGMEGRVEAPDGGPDAWSATVRAFARLGFSHVCFSSLNAGYRSPDDHIAAIRLFREVVAGLG
jgi:probable F420-dependent oxidoreductase